ncbi:response regulator transcription factor [Streptosporangium sp. KLBMP 9127]|nr:response regulator transcription factor [Streptosporangium sp. KLBMP 9127]
MRLLIIEDESTLADILAEGLRIEGIATDIALDGDRGLELATVHDYDVIILDRDLPLVHGDDICRTLAGRDGVSARILMLTSAGSLEDLVGGLALGADDYLSKPFSYPELLARVHALARRARPAAAPVLTCGGVEVDVQRRTARRDGRQLTLTPKELGVLEELVRAEGAPVSTVHLLEKVWDAELDPFSGVLKVVVHGLRRKLGDPPLIQTVSRFGYRI